MVGHAAQLRMSRQALDIMQTQCLLAVKQPCLYGRSQACTYYKLQILCCCLGRRPHTFTPCVSPSIPQRLCAYPSNPELQREERISRNQEVMRALLGAAAAPANVPRACPPPPRRAPHKPRQRGEPRADAPRRTTRSRAPLEDGALADTKAGDSPCLASRAPRKNRGSSATQAKGLVGPCVSGYLSAWVCAWPRMALAGVLADLGCAVEHGLMLGCP